MSGWPTVKLEEIADVIDSMHQTPEYTSEGYPMVRVTDVRGGYLNFSNALKVSEDVFNKFSKNHIPKPGDIVFSRVGSYGNASIVKTTEKFCLGQNTAFIVPKQDPRFLYYFLNSPAGKNEIESSVAGSTQPTVSLKSIRNFEVPQPSLEEQRAIAAILSSLDDKIDLLHRQNKTLEAMAETLFRQWFVEEVEVEEDSKEGTIADLIEFNPTRKLAKGSIVPYLEMASLSNTTFHPESWYDRTFSSGTKFINGDTLLARITPCLENGKTAYVTFLKDGQVGWGSTEYIVMRPKRNLHPFFAYSLARNGDFRDYAEGCLEGSSGRQRVNVDHLKNYKIKIPSVTATNQFNALSESITPKLHSNFLQIRTLETLRDTLLPKLMSGEIRVAV